MAQSYRLSTKDSNINSRNLYVIANDLLYVFGKKLDTYKVIVFIDGPVYSSCFTWTDQCVYLSRGKTARTMYSSNCPGTVDVCGVVSKSRYYNLRPVIDVTRFLGLRSHYAVTWISVDICDLAKNLPKMFFDSQWKQCFNMPPRCDTANCH